MLKSKLIKASVYFSLGLLIFSSSNLSFFYLLYLYLLYIYMCLSFPNITSYGPKLIWSQYKPSSDYVSPNRHFQEKLLTCLIHLANWFSFGASLVQLTFAMTWTHSTMAAEMEDYTFSWKGTWQADNNWGLLRVNVHLIFCGLCCLSYESIPCISICNFLKSQSDSLVLQGESQ